MNKFGAKLKEKRIQSKLTQSALAEMLNVSDRTVSKWETGRGYPDITLINTIANCLDTTVNELLDSEDIKAINLTNQRPADDSFRITFRKKMMLSISLLAPSILLFILPILKNTVPPDGAIGSIAGESNIYTITAIMLSVLVSLCYISSISIFTYIIIQYSNQIRNMFNSFLDKIIIKRYVYFYLLFLILMVGGIVIALSISL